ncbi:MAG: phenylalanine--tRNA ligase subunit beta [Tepidisphaera sp.]
MHASVRWLNQYLTPANLTADEAADVLMNLGFPIETREEVVFQWETPDTRLDVEVTSNRGDCLSQVGLAREIAAKTGRAFAMPVVKAVPGNGRPVASALKLDVRTPDACPRFTARVIRGVKVGPSPAWLVRALEAVGQRSINNVVDVTNFICFELGNPCHVFDLSKLEGAALVVRFASDGERLLTLDGKERKLRADELVVADNAKPQSLAGVIGGGESEVTAATTDVVLEVATWDPATIRRAARRLQIRTDAGHRFERVVDARTLQYASDRAAALIVEVAGGELCEGTMTGGKDLPPARTIDLRLSRCRSILGYAIEDARISTLLSAQGLAPVSKAAGVVTCTIPATRVDLTGEIDLIEEVARTNGLDAIPMAEKLPVAVKPPQDSQRAMREIAGVLTAQGYFEAVTFSFVKPAIGAAWIPKGLAVVNVDDERRGAEPTLRPSVIPNLLACRKANQDGQVKMPGESGIRLFEIASVFGQADGKSAEHRNIALLADVPVSGKKPTIADLQTGVRTIRGTIESLVKQLGGAAAELAIVKAAPHCDALDAGSYATVLINGVKAGYLAVVGSGHAQSFGLESVHVCAELNLAAVVGLFPPKSRVEALPTFPAVERDLSPIVAEAMTWDEVRTVVSSSKLPRLESLEFVGTFRGKQIGAGKKSLTLRLRFRDAGKTLRHEEVDTEVNTLVGLLNTQCGASWRTV